MQLYDRVTVVAHYLTTTLKLKAGERVILSFPPGPEFLPVILACFATGIIAVPTYPPNPGSWEKDTARLALIAKVSGSKYALTNKMFMLVVQASRLKRFFKGDKASIGVPWKSIPDSVLFSLGKSRPLTPYPTKPEDVAFLQFTSGSTGDPKGVIVKHGNMVHNLSTMQNHCRIKPGVTLVSWMPQYHDFGLIVMMLLPTMYGGHAVCMSPLSFLKVCCVYMILNVVGNMKIDPCEIIDLCAVESPCMADNHNQVQRVHHCVSKFRYVMDFAHLFFNASLHI